MEPQPFGHGNLAAWTAEFEASHPSMEPQPFGHGNPSVAWSLKPSM